MKEQGISIRSCGICFGIVNKRGKLDCCDHQFCFECINEWQKQNPSCPTCRGSIKSLRITRHKLSKKYSRSNKQNKVEIQVEQEVIYQGTNRRLRQLMNRHQFISGYMIRLSRTLFVLEQEMRAIHLENARRVYLQVPEVIVIDSDEDEENI